MTRLIFAALALALLAGCKSDFASPFDKPDETTQPVKCEQESCK